ncbi:MAG: 16S rRNA (cytidine(1402)-2'-O)-methyltransferase [Elusimicrobiota bacterium]|jgi:16S rRNA (cytidine1402-2'-O)-methyltransferase|nr:16S rRNA (cytidine(1402)-2'-O)-methyltransferase [Elusimicrobiota bacterium]
MSSKLFIVPTPIGNLEDITLRALRVLKECSFIACEDTRVSVKLLNHFEISKPLISFYSYNQQKRVPEIIDKILNGSDAALISDAGMPAISDPGYMLVRAAIDKGIIVEVLPGASAAITALIGSGLPTDGYIFCGFLKKKSGKMKKELSQAAALGKTIIFYESPRRIIKTAELCREVFGGKTQMCVARELTKKFEEFIRGDIESVIEQLKSKKEILGEMAVLINAASSLLDENEKNKKKNK